MAVKPCSNTLKIAPCSCGTRSTLAHSIGVNVRATNPEITTAPATAIPNSLSSRPVEPRRKPNGVNTATSAIVVAITAKPISLVPLTAACSGASCSSSWCRSEEHTSELQSQSNLVCRLLLEKKKKKTNASSVMNSQQ